MDLFYKPGIGKSDKVLLTPEESKHAIRVKRYKKGEEVIVVDGTGGFYKAVIEIDDPKSCTLTITESHQNFEPLPYHLHIAIAPTKSRDRFEWFLEKATEIGITHIHPLICEHSERRKLRVDRMESIVVSAMKQSVKAFKPFISEPIELEKWFSRQHSGLCYIAHCSEGEKENIWDVPLEGDYTIMIGPEGDFSEDEIILATGNGFKPLSLGSQRFRTETAGLAACSAIYYNHQK